MRLLAKRPRAPKPEALADGGPRPRTAAGAITTVAQGIIDELVLQGVRGLAVCGVAEGDGVSSVATDLAIELGRAGVSTLLIDANLRTPRLHALFGAADQATPGLTDLLLHPERESDWAIHADIRPGLSVLFAGDPVPGAADALSEAAFVSRMDDWLRSFAFTIVDTPPAGLSADTLRLARLAGSALLVVRRDHTFVADLTLLINELRDQGVTIFGSVLTEV